MKSGQLASAVVGTINVLGTVVAASLMDKFGRKQLLSTSFSGMGLAMLAMSAGMSMRLSTSSMGLLGVLTAEGSMMNIVSTPYLLRFLKLLSKLTEEFYNVCYKRLAHSLHLTFWTSLNIMTIALILCMKIEMSIGVERG